MPYEAVSAYTVLVGETGSATTVTVHGSADEAWRALAEAVRSRSTRWMPRGTEAATLADRWRMGAPERRFWQVSAHRLQVMVPTGGAPPTRPASPSTEPPKAGYTHSYWRPRRRKPSPQSAGRTAATES